MSKIAHVALATAMLGLLCSADANAQMRFGLNAVGAYNFISGPAGNALSGGWGGEGTLFVQSRHLRFGAGFNFASIATDRQIVSDAWTKMFLYGSFGSAFQTYGRFVPHFDVRLGWSQLTPDESLAIDKGSCTGCGDCVDRCAMEALSVIDEVVQVYKAHCIGCGNCVSTCPAEALSMVRRSSVVPPEGGMTMGGLAV